jgi:hypothetical protein
VGLRKWLLVLAACIVVVNAALWGMTYARPAAPEAVEGAAIAEPSPERPPATAPSPAASGFPTMDLPPPRIDVPLGEPQPIATKFGLTYDIPAGWDNWFDGFVGWNGDDGTSATYGAVGFYDRRDCAGGNHRDLAMTGMTGRQGGDLEALALAEVSKAEVIYSSDVAEPSVKIGSPVTLTIGGEPAVRYTAIIDNIPPSDDCRPTEARFDVITTPGYATAETAVFVVRADTGVAGALSERAIDSIISSIRKS